MEFKNLFMGLIMIGLLSAVIVMAAVKPDYSFSIEPAQDVLSVSGSGVVTVMPDKAEVYVNIFTEAATAEEAKNLNAEISDNVVKALKGADINKDNIETSSYNLNIKRKWLEDEEQYITVGYELRHTIKVTTEDIDIVGSLIDISVEAGATGINQVKFDLTEDSKLEFEKEALTKATEEAKLRAETMADAADVELKKIVSIESNTGYNPYLGFVSQESLDIRKDAETTVLPKNLEISASASLVYEIE